MNPPRWISKTFVLALHGRLLAEHGGATGIRDEGLQESALASHQDHAAYRDAGVFDLADAYAHALTSNHPFVDGNKRVAFAAAGIFLELNGQRLIASEVDAVGAMLALSCGEMGAEEFARWTRENAEQLDS